MLRASEKYSMQQDNALAELEIRDLELQDAGDYTCVCGDQHTTASLTVNGKFILQMTVQFWLLCNILLVCEVFTYQAFLGVDLCSGKEIFLF